MNKKTPVLGLELGASDHYKPRTLSTTSHASIAYRKQLPSQRAVGIIGSVWQESTLRRKLRGHHKLTRKAETLEKRTVGNAKRRTRGLSLSPRALSNWF